MRSILTLAFFETFLHQGRLCAVFELMKCNLRTALAKYGAAQPSGAVEMEMLEGPKKGAVQGVFELRLFFWGRGGNKNEVV